jgi:FAD/FMN-containing dehydrogenase
MNKIATYLNQHLLGEASSAKAVRKRYSRDGSILTITPEIVVFPRVSSDIRKTARFTWQLAEKGHLIGMTPRGFGYDTSGGAIGKGVAIDTSTYLNKIVTIAPKDRLVHVQAGISLKTLLEALRWQGLTLPVLPVGSLDMTIGGAIASNAFGVSGQFAQSIQKLEVVLANGDVIETGRVDRREVNKKLGLQTFEGEMYRKLSGLFEDNEALLERLVADDTIDSVGYKAIASVRQKDGSFDLTPLFVASQGTLGIITEVVLKTEFYSADETSALVMVETAEMARDLTDRLVELQPGQLMTIDSTLLNKAMTHGKVLPLIGDQEVSGTAILIRFNDISDRAQLHKIKKLRKLIQKMNLPLLDSTDHDPAEFTQLFDIATVLANMADDDGVSLPIFDGSYIPRARREEFAGLIDELATKHHVALPSITNPLNGTISFYPDLKLQSVSDKQKLFRIMSEYAAAIAKCDGAVASDGAEGRVKAPSAWSTLDDEETALYEQIRDIFDPFKTLNPGVKQKADVRTLVAHLRTSFDTTDSMS